jgi:hypothetical protein
MFKHSHHIEHLLSCQDEGCSLRLDEHAMSAESNVLGRLLSNIRRGEDLAKLRRHLSVQQFMRLGLSMSPPEDRELTREQMCFVGTEALRWAPPGAVLSFVDLLTIQTPADGTMPERLWIRQHTAAVGKDKDWINRFCGKPMEDFLGSNGTTLVGDGHLKRTRELPIVGREPMPETQCIGCCEREYLVPSTPPETRSPHAWEEFLESQGIARNAHSHIAVGISLPERPELRFRRVVGHVWLEFNHPDYHDGKSDMYVGGRVLLPTEFVAAFEYALGALCITYLAEVASKALDRTSRLQQIGEARALRLRKSSVKVETQYKSLEAAMRELRQEIAGTPAATVQSWLDQTVQSFFDTASQIVKVLRFSFASSHSLWNRERAAAMLCALAAVPDDGVSENAEATWRRWLTMLTAADFEHSELLRCLRRAGILEDRFLTWAASKEERNFFELTGKAGREKSMTPFRFLLSTGAHLLKEGAEGKLHGVAADSLVWPRIGELERRSEGVPPNEILLDALRRMAEANLAHLGHEVLDPVGFAFSSDKDQVRVILIPSYTLVRTLDGSASWRRKEPRSQDVNKLWTKYSAIRRSGGHLEGSDATKVLLELDKACELLKLCGLHAALAYEKYSISLIIYAKESLTPSTLPSLEAEANNGQYDFDKDAVKTSLPLLTHPPMATPGVRIISFRLKQKQTWATAAAAVGLNHDAFDGNQYGGQSQLLREIAEIESTPIPPPLLFLFHGGSQHPPMAQVKKLCAAGKAVALFGTADKIANTQGDNWWMIYVDDEVEAAETKERWMIFFRRLTSASSLGDCRAACQEIYDFIRERPR